MPVPAGTRFRVTIDRLSLGGDGVARWKDLVVFVPYTAPQDEVEVEVVQSHARFLRAHPVGLVRPSPQRVKPPCPYHFQLEDSLNPVRRSPASPAGGLGEGGWCGGCSWQHLDYTAQLANKSRLVQETFERVGGLPNLPVRPTLGMSEPWRYRNKVQQPVGWDGRKIISGFFAPNSHELVAIEDCLLQPELSVRLINRSRELLRAAGARTYDEDRHLGWLRHIWVRTAQGKAMLMFVTRTGDFPSRDRILQTVIQEFPELVGIHQNINPARTNVILGREWMNLAGSDFLEEKLGPIRYALSPVSFFQVNTAQAEVLYSQVKQRAGKGDVLVDLYSGVGGIALFLAANFRDVIGIESVGPAVENARENARRNGIPHVSFLAADVAKGLQQIRRDVPAGSVIVLDPPRAGCDPSVLDAVVRLNPSKILYVSCDPGTLARDVARLVKSPYAISFVQPVDLFPQTPHIETVVELIRK